MLVAIYICFLFFSLLLLSNKMSNQMYIILINDHSLTRQRYSRSPTAYSKLTAAMTTTTTTTRFTLNTNKRSWQFSLPHRQPIYKICYTFIDGRYPRLVFAQYIYKYSYMYYETMGTYYIYIYILCRYALVIQSFPEGASLRRLETT